MNRQQRRAARKRKLEVGTVIHTQTIKIAGEHYWFECSENFSPEDGLPSGAHLHGPFQTDAEVREHQRLTLFGPQCDVKAGGAWDPAWEKPQ